MDAKSSCKSIPPYCGTTLNAYTCRPGSKSSEFNSKIGAIGTLGTGRWFIRIYYRTPPTIRAQPSSPFPARAFLVNLESTPPPPCGFASWPKRVNDGASTAVVSASIRRFLQEQPIFSIAYIDPARRCESSDRERNRGSCPLPFLTNTVPRPPALVIGTEWQ